MLGDVVPIPISPVLPSMVRALLGAAGKIRNGSVLPLVASRMKKLASFPARSQVWGVNPLEPSCSRRSVGVLPLLMWMSVTGVEVPRPRRPPSSTYSEWLGAPASMVKGVRPPSMSSIENLFCPPLEESLKVICQSLLGKLAEELVS